MRRLQPKTPPPRGSASLCRSQWLLVQAPNAIVSIQAVNEAAGTVSIYGAQLEQAATAGVYVMTTGASAAGQGGIATFTTATLLGGSHPVTGVYSGDTNYLGNTGALNSPLTVGQGSATAVVASSLSPSNYGVSVTFTATVTGPNATPTGTITFLDGATTIGTGTSGCHRQSHDGNISPLLWAIIRSPSIMVATATLVL